MTGTSGIFALLPALLARANTHMRLWVKTSSVCTAGVTYVLKEKGGKKGSGPFFLYTEPLRTVFNSLPSTAFLLDFS